VNDKTQPLGYRTIPHGDTSEVFTSGTAPSGSSCASVKKTAQCLNGRMWVDGVPTAAFTQFFSNCTDPAPVRPGGFAPGSDGHCETEELPIVEGQEPEYAPKCSDRDCAGIDPCPAIEDEICNNSVDDDQNGSTDCADPQCRDKVECSEDETQTDECGGTDVERCTLVNEQIAAFQEEWRKKKATMPAADYVRGLLAACAKSTESWKNCCPTATMPARGEVMCSQLPTETEPVGY